MKKAKLSFVLLSIFSLSLVTSNSTQAQTVVFDQGYSIQYTRALSPPGGVATSTLFDTFVSGSSFGSFSVSEPFIDNQGQSGPSEAVGVSSTITGNSVWASGFSNAAELDEVFGGAVVDFAVGSYSLSFAVAEPTDYTLAVNCDSCGGGLTAAPSAFITNNGLDPVFVFIDTIPNSGVLEPGQYEFFVGAGDVGGTAAFTFHLDIGAVPEPSSGLILLLGSGVGLLRRKRKLS